jgi:serpin B
MKKKIHLLACLGVLAMNFNSRATPPAVVPEAVHQAMIADNAFAADLYAQLRMGKGNICVSPYSISSALEMASAGAQGKTAAQLMSVLHWTEDRAKLPTDAAALSKAMLDQGQDPKAAQVEIANAMFGQKGYPYRQEFLNTLSEQYNATFQSMDFLHDSAGAVEQINQWAAEKTRDKIKNALPESAVNSTTRLVLVNAVYFKGTWTEPFKKTRTKDEPFYEFESAKQGESKPVAMMTQQAYFNFTQDKMVQAVELPYHGDYAMLVLLPAKRGGLAELEKNLTPVAIAAWVSGMKSQEVEVSLPRFKMECAYDLKPPLQKLGMPDAFDEAADFSGIASLERLKIDAIVHKTYIDVDEQGTEAAAITGVTVGAMAVRVPQQVAVFRADHPFVYLIRNRTTGTILFMGRVTLPN